MDRENCGPPSVVLTLLSAGKSILSCSLYQKIPHDPLVIPCYPMHLFSHIVLLYLKNAIYAFIAIAIYFLVSLHWYGADCLPK